MTALYDVAAIGNAIVDVIAPASDDFLAALQKELEPSYSYIDCKGTGTKNAGVFLLRPAPQN